ncbi:hypothetical protein [Actinacidiphila glaucinigra]|uniref:hypothetical protein n=1 Tax=Actinacidiphila glaucinigra TaxID=235986 RepID=UPI003711EBA7
MKRLTALRTRVRVRGDSGQTSFEYLGIAVVIAVIIGVLATTDIGQAVKTGILSAITRIVGGG